MVEGKGTIWGVPDAPNIRLPYAKVPPSNNELIHLYTQNVIVLLM